MVKNINADAVADCLRVILLKVFESARAKCNDDPAKHGEHQFLEKDLRRWEFGEVVRIAQEFVDNSCEEEWFCQRKRLRKNDKYKN